VHADCPGVPNAGECGHHVSAVATARPAAKKKTLHAAERDTPRVQQARLTYGEQLAAVNIQQLKFVDESGVNLALTRSYGWAPVGEVFRAFVEQVLCPTLCAGDIVVMDNLGAHKVTGIREAIEGYDAQVMYLPPYSPDLSPIEQCWSKLKTILLSVGARTREALDAAIAQALEKITTADALAWFTHCGCSRGYDDCRG
jgi:transposase